MERTNWQKSYQRRDSGIALKSCPVSSKSVSTVIRRMGGSITAWNRNCFSERLSLTTVHISSVLIMVIHRSFMNDLFRLLENGIGFEIFHTRERFCSTANSNTDSNFHKTSSSSNLVFKQTKNVIQNGLFKYSFMCALVSHFKLVRKQIIVLNHWLTN